MSKEAKSVIEIWMWGGPCQLDTFDPKPDAPYDYTGGRKAIDTCVDGLQLHEWLPELAKCANLFSVIRSMTHPHFGHETATYLMQTGRMPGGGEVYPAIGAVIAMMKAKSYSGDIPPFVILTGEKGRFSELGFLSEKYAPLVTGGNPNMARFIVDGIVPPGGLSDAEVDERFGLLGKLDTYGRTGAPASAALKEFDTAGAAARKIIKGDAARTFDLSQESAATRDRYGRTPFAQSLLAARRLVEYGVPYITVNMSGWDSHKRHFETMERRTREFDKALAALLEDLKAHGLLDTTVVWASGEFGRTPKVDWDPPWNGGRNHFANCFSMLVAGGGFKGGQVVGKSDETTDHWKERPVTPQDFLGSIMELAGVDPDDRLPNPKWLKEYGPVMNPKVKSPCGRLKEIYV